MSNIKYLFSIFAALACVSLINVSAANAGGGCKKKCYKRGKHHHYHYDYGRERETYWREPTVLAWQRSPIIRRSVGMYGQYQHPNSISYGGYGNGSYSGSLTIEAGVIGHRGYTVAGGYSSGYLGHGSIYSNYPSYYDDSYDSYYGGYGSYGGYAGYGELSVEVGYGYGSSY